MNSDTSEPKISKADKKLLWTICKLRYVNDFLQKIIKILNFNDIVDVINKKIL